jgi:transposase-like protein
MDFPLLDLLDADACYNQLVAWLHPEGMACHDCGRADHLRIHRRRREPVVDYRCDHCGRVFNAFTGTALQGIHYRPSAILTSLMGKSCRSRPLAVVGGVSGKIHDATKRTLRGLLGAALPVPGRPSCAASL